MEYWKRQEAEKKYRAAAVEGTGFIVYRNSNTGAIMDARRLTVTKATKTQLLLSDGKRMQRETGTIVGESKYSSTCYVSDTSENRAMVAAANADREAASSIRNSLEKLRALRPADLTAYAADLQDLIERHTLAPEHKEA
jgi:hypothetical protein